MPKPKKNKKREDQVKDFSHQSMGVSPKVVQQLAADAVFKSPKDKPYFKRFLILCEGETEAAYFEGLCKVWQLRVNLDIEILPEEGRTDKHKGSSVKGLLYMAMQKQTTAKIPYDEVWIVTDNDEENAYKLDTNSLNRIKKDTPQYIGEKMTAFQKVKTAVRKGEEDERMRYFLCRNDYEAFLKTHILETPDLRFLDEVVTLTTKKNDFNQLYEGDKRAFFYDTEGSFITTNNHGEAQFEEKYFDKNWRTYIQTAYSCISFEQWILLHFEQGIAFYNSRNIIRHFDDKHYFEGHFQKGWYLYERLDDFPVKKAFFRSVHQAIKNNLCLNSAMQTDIKNGKKFYEVNPYSDVFRLTALLLNNQNTTLAFVGEPVSYRDFNDISVSHKGRIVSISFVFDRKKPVLKREIEALFSVVDANDTSVLTYKTVANEEPIRKGDTVRVVLTIKDEVASPFFLYLKEQDKGVEYVLVWVL